MRSFSLTTALITLALIVAPAWADKPAVHLEVATDPKAPFGAQETWYRLLNELGVTSLRLRQASGGDKPAVENIGTDSVPQYRLTAVVDAKNRIHVPGASFATRDRGRLAEYLRKLREDGIQGLTASRGLFGLTDEQFQAVHADLSQKVAFSTAGERPRSIVDTLADRLAHRLVIDGRLLDRLDGAESLSAELQELSRGTALAVVLRHAGLVFRPQMTSGKLLYEVVEAQDPARGKPNAEVPETALSWPVGWEPTLNPGRTAPELFEIISAQIDGYTLAESLEAIRSRLKVPLIVDERGIQAKRIDLAEVQVTLPAVRYSYDRILSRILFQGRLKGTLRVDERGAPFYWITPL